MFSRVSWILRVEMIYDCVDRVFYGSLDLNKIFYLLFFFIVINM